MVTCVVLESKQGATRGLVVGVVPSAGPRAEAWRTGTRVELPYKGNFGVFCPLTLIKKYWLKIKK